MSTALTAESSPTMRAKAAQARLRAPAVVAHRALFAAFLPHDLTHSLFFAPEVAPAFWLVFSATTAEDEPT